MSDKGQISDYLLIGISLVLALLLFSFLGASLKMVVVVVLALAIFITAFLSMDTALIILIFAMLLSPEIELAGIPRRAVVVRIDDLLLFVIFFGWLARMAVNKELGLLRTSPLNTPILAYIAICLLSTAVGAVRGTTSPVHAFFYILKYVEYFVIFFMVSNSIRDMKQVKLFVSCILLTAAVVSVYAIRSYFVLGIRATAPFEGAGGEANTLAGYLLIIMGIILGLFVYTRRMRLRILLGGYFAYLTVPLLYTLSRGGWIGFFPMYLTSLLVSRRTKWVLALPLACALLIGPFILPQVARERIRRTFSSGREYTVLGKKITLDNSAAARISSLKASFEEWKKNPFIGQGVASGRAVFEVQYARILRELGSIGMLTFLWIIITLFRVAWQGLQAPGLDDYAKGLSLGFISALVGLLFMGFAAEVFIIIRIMEPFWFLAAIVVMLPQISAPPEASSQKPGATETESGDHLLRQKSI